MKSRATLIGCALVVLCAPEAQSQSVAQIVGSDVKHAAQDFAAIWTSPLRGTGKDYLIVAGVLGAAALVSPMDDEVDRWAIDNEKKGFLKAIKPFRRGGDFYSINELTPYVAGLYVIGVATKHQGIRDGIFGCVAAYGANTTIRHQVVYRLIGRDRPEPIKNPTDANRTPPAQHGDQYDFNVPSDGWGQHSFPGGHIATMTTCASFLSHRFEMGLVEPVLAGLVGVMGIGRIADRGHWVSDQIVGAAFGFAIGREVARRQLKRNATRDAAEAEEAAAPGVTSAPFIGTDANGTRVGWQVTF
jgi:membrane-associated phospholipid phosphatase